jgi:hypothetical protein
MRTRACLTIALLAVLAMAGSASSQNAVSSTTESSFSGGGGGYSLSGADCQGSILAVHRQLESTDLRCQQVMAQLAAAKQKLDAVQAQVRAGLAITSDVMPVQLEVQNAEIQLEQCHRDQVQLGRLLALAQPVDVSLKSANIRQAAEVLSSASGLKITVDAKVPQNVFVTTEAEGVPVGGVLEVIASSAHLTIVPQDVGIVLRNPGQLRIDGKDVAIDGCNSPWSDEWSTGGLPSPLGRRWLRLFEGTSSAECSAQQASSPVRAGNSAPSAILTGVGQSTLVVGEAGTGPQGEPGLWLTLYQLKNGRFVPGTRTFHRSVTSQPIAAPSVKPTSSRKSPTPVKKPVRTNQKH